MCSSAATSRTARAPASRSFSTRPRPVCWSRRRSAGSATGGTRSSSASRPTSRGGSRSTRRGVPDDYLFDETFHPTFLYEALWNLGAAGLLLILDRRFRFRPPALFALYVSLYTAFRFYLEILRIDPSKEFGGLRVNAWVSLILFVASTLFFIWWQFLRGRRERRRESGPKPAQPQTMAVPRGRVRPRR